MEQPAKGTVSIIAPDCGSLAVLIARSSPARGGDVGEGCIGANDNVTGEISDDTRPVDIRRFKSASSHLGI